MSEEKDLIAEHEERVTRQLQAALGRDDVIAVFDQTPLLRAEKTERKWPDDFRGFHTNVRPKKQR